MPSFKDLPNDLNTENAVLGAMISDNSVAILLLSSLNIDDFCETNLKNRLIFSAIKRISDRGNIVDTTSVMSELNVANQLNTVTEDYIFDLVEQSLDTTNFEYYVEILRNYALLRGFLTTIRGIETEYDEGSIRNITDYLTASEQKINNVLKNRRISGFKKTSEIAGNVTEELLNRVNGDHDTLPGITTGYEKLDIITSGFKKGELIYLAARPSVGKTALALNMCYNAASRTHKPVAVFELEMQAEQLFKRLLANRSSVELDKIIKGYLSNKEKLSIKEAAKELANVPIYIDDSRANTIDDILAKSRKLKNELGDLGLIVVDYIGIISDSKYVSKNTSRQEIVSSYSRKLKELAGELNVPVLALSQLTRKVDEREDKKPQISDLRESGSLEQDADIVLLIYRPSYYTDQGINIKIARKNNNSDNSEIKEPLSGTSDGGDLVDLIVAKNRNGAIGNAKLIFFKNYGKFVSPAKETEEIANNFSEDIM